MYVYFLLTTPFTNNDLLNQHRKKEMESNYIYVKEWRVTIHPWSKFNGGLIKRRWSYGVDE